MYEEYINKTFYNWTIIQFSYKDKFNHPFFRCRCSCGKTKDIDLFQLKYGKSKSCRNCAKKETTFHKHNLSHSRLYGLYYGIKDRCLNPNNLQYKNYGGRKISICPEWKSDFMNFYEWAIANGYSDKLTIDRIDVDGNYCPENCRWVDIKIQANNRRNNHIIEYKGISYTTSQFCEKFKLNRKTIDQRISRYGYTNPELLLKKSLKGNLITLKGQTKTLVEWCNLFNLNYETIRNRIYKYGYSPEEALTKKLKNGKFNPFLVAE